MVKNRNAEERKEFALADYKGSWNIGAFGIATDRYVIFGEGFRPQIIRAAKEVFNNDIIIQNVMDEPIVGIMLAGNSKGLLVPYNIYEKELEELKRKLDVPVEKLELKTYENALGNIILANDYGAVIHEEIYEKNKESIKVIEDVLDVEVAAFDFSTVVIGSVACATNKGVLVSPMLLGDEIDFIKEVLKVKVDKGTVNMGSQYIRSGLIANSFGFLAGLRTTGIELHKIYETLVRG